MLIVGGGPVGLALAAELGWRGIRCELVEQADGAISTPKMNEVNTRTMEFCRRWGIAEAVRNCPFPDDHRSTWCSSPASPAMNWRGCGGRRAAQQKAESHSPERLQICSQLVVRSDPARVRAVAAAVTLRYRTRLESFEASATA